MEATERCARPIAEWDEERDAPDQECVACRHSMHTPSELDPTALCNGCAQAYAAATAPVVLALIARIGELESAQSDAMHYLLTPTCCENRSEEGRRRYLVARLRELLEKGTVIP
jgi:hypothetical protein